MPERSPLLQLGDLFPHLRDPAWAAIDCRTDLTNPSWGRGAYLQSHIPGALHADLETDLSAPRTGLNGRHPLPSPEDLAPVFSRWGIDDDVEVVAYDAGADFFAARLWWTLRYLGHTRVHVLDGGLSAWQAEGLPVSAGEEARTPRRFVPRPQPDLVTPITQVLHAERLIDARAPERFRGEVEPLDRVAGHIPGARSYEWRRSLGPDGRMLPARALRAQLEGALAGVAPEQTVVYCGSGVSASHVLLAMAVAGLHGARLYPGSWSEWCADPARPVATGDQDGRMAP
jgi:thiosulfate/3-mercaptopyruvate sulfurtransferase